MDIERARFNMIEQQIRPWNVSDPKVLECFRVIKREDFVPKCYRHLAFADFEIPLSPESQATGQYMFSPKIEARILQALALKLDDHVLEIGTGSGYLTALCAYCAHHVTSVEISAPLLDYAQRHINTLGIENIDLILDDAAQGLKQQLFFDAIIISGALPELPENFTQQLNIGGRIVAFIGEAPLVKAQLISKISATECTTQHLFDTYLARLQGVKQVHFHF